MRSADCGDGQDKRLDACRAALDEFNHRMDAWEARLPDRKDAYERDLDENKPIKVSGVKGARSTSFTKRFPNMRAYDRWSDTEEAGDYEVYRVEQA